MDANAGENHMRLADGLSNRDGVLRERAPARRGRRRIQPLTWIVTVAVMPVLLYDVWQTVQDVKHRHAAGGYASAVELSSSAASRPRELASTRSY
jgi:hypothetical protein